MTAETPLVIENLSFRYRDRETIAIRNISFSRKSGRDIIDRRRERLWKNDAYPLHQRSDPTLL